MARFKVALLLAMTFILALSSGYYSVTAAPDPGLPVLGIWDPVRKTSNITATIFTPGSPLTLDINITNAPLFNAFEFFLFYDFNTLATSTELIDEKTGFFDNPISFVKTAVPAGQIRLGVANLGVFGAKQGNGTVARITFNVVKLGVSPLVFAAASTNPSSGAQSWTRMVNGDILIDLTTSDGYFKNIGPEEIGPVASFTFSPPDPDEGDTVAFDATGSFDPNNSTALGRGIATFIWNFGDGAPATRDIITEHVFATPQGSLFSGNFSVLLTVVDTKGFIGMKTLRVHVVERPIHDVLVDVVAKPDVVRAGTDVNVEVTVKNQGTFDEVFNLTVTYGPPDQVLDTVLSHSIVAKRTATFNFLLKTSDLEPSVYTITAIVKIPLDERPGNNQDQAFIQIPAPSSSPFLFAVGGLVAVAGLGTTTALILRRRRKEDEE